jgi:hypothetical protein
LRASCAWSSALEAEGARKWRICVTDMVGGWDGMAFAVDRA